MSAWVLLLIFDKILEQIIASFFQVNQLRLTLNLDLQTLCCLLKQINRIVSTNDQLLRTRAFFFD